MTAEYNKNAYRAASARSAGRGQAVRQLSRNQRQGGRERNRFLCLRFSLVHAVTPPAERRCRLRGRALSALGSGRAEKHRASSEAGDDANGGRSHAGANEVTRKRDANLNPKSSNPRRFIGRAAGGLAGQVSVLATPPVSVSAQAANTHRANICKAADCLHRSTASAFRPTFGPKARQQTARHISSRSTGLCVCGLKATLSSPLMLGRQ